jgi:hypothetical protein
MRSAVWFSTALFLARAAAAQEDGGAPASSASSVSFAADATGSSLSKPAPARLLLPPADAFQLFPQLTADPRLGLAGALDDRRLFHQPGDPDSVFTFGKPSPGGEVHLLAVVDVNEIFLKAIPPDPLVQGNDTRPRAAGSFLPVDSQGRPYQLRLGARLIW